jgi:anaerobic ribonucleoside-triphosphate reductase-activating protein
LSILGGEPLWQNIDGMADLEKLCHVTHKLDKTVWMWTGFTWEELMTPPPHPDATWLMRRELVMCCDVLVDGRFEKDLKDPTLPWAGSTNQRVIDVQKSLAAGQVILRTGKD